MVLKLIVLHTLNHDTCDVGPPMPKVLVKPIGIALELSEKEKESLRFYQFILHS